MKNVLMIAIDDLNNWTTFLKGYGGTVHTPNLDRLMATGTTFTNAFASAAICNPSRTSIMTGLSPMQTGILQNQADWEAAVRPQDTIFGIMKAAGYETISLGKVLHTGPSPLAMEQMFDRYSFLGQKPPKVGFDGLLVGPVPDGTVMSDQLRADEAVKIIQNADAGKPLFLSVGFDKPHYEWIVPQRYFDLYPLDKIVIDKTPDNYDELPDFIKDYAGQKHPFDKDAVKNDLIFRKLVQGYLASISYMDDQLGRVIKAAEASPQAKNTTIVLWSDHGYHLGDRDFWHKFTLWDNADRAPLVIKDLGGAPARVIHDTVELREVFPTLLDIAGLQSPVQGIGRSLMDYVRHGARDGRHEAITWMYGSVSLRTNDYRFTLYEDGSRELYDVRRDPELGTNLAGRPGFAALAAQMETELRGACSLYGYSPTATRIEGSPRADVLASQVHGAELIGGAGDDSYFVTPSARIVERPDGGRDRVVLYARDYTLPANVEDLEVIGFSDRISGNDLGNRLTAAAREIRGLGGDDFIVSTRTGAMIYGGDGDDTVMARGAEMVVHGDAGNDVLLGGKFNDVLGGGAGHDTILGDLGNDWLYGMAGADRILGGSGDDRIFAGIGDDHADGGAGNDAIEGESGNDLLGGGEGHDTIDGGAGDDLIFGGRGNDLLRGGTGNDRIFAGLGNDTAEGGAGNDAIEGESGNDLLGGGEGHDTIDGGAGNDRIFGGQGNDLLRGGTGNDRIFAGLGNDTAEGGAGNDAIEGESGNDLLGGGEGHDTIDGGAGNDLIFGGQGNDLLRGGTGDDRIHAGIGHDSVDGEIGHDWIDGEFGNDNLNGAGGNDTILGAAGNDTLRGGQGDDLMTGGTGADQFVFAKGWGRDRITDFEDGIDSLRLHGFNLSGFDQLAAYGRQVGNDTILDFGGGDVLILQGVTLASLQGDVVFS